MVDHESTIRWDQDSTASILNLVNTPGQHGGIPDTWFGRTVHLYDAHPEDVLRGTPGQVIARRHGALCRATVDGAVWIGHIRRHNTESAPAPLLPATEALADFVSDVPTVPVALSGGGPRTYREINYHERDGIAVIDFAFYRGAVSAAQCERLLDVYHYACERPLQAIVLHGAPRCWCGGIHQGLIAAAPNPTAATRCNIAAIDALIAAILNAVDNPTVAMLRGDARGGGAFLALAADWVLAQHDVTLQLSGVGGLPESAYWEYLLTRRRQTPQVLQQLPHLTATEAADAGLIDRIADIDQALTAPWLRRYAALANSAPQKSQRRQRDEQRRPLAVWQAAALQTMRCQLDDPQSPFHRAIRANR